MSVYRKDNDGNIIKVGGYVEKRIIPRYFTVEWSLDPDGQELYLVPTDAKLYYSSIGVNTVYFFEFSKANTTNNPKLKYGEQILSLQSYVTGQPPKVGELHGVYQLFTKSELDGSIFVMPPIMMGNMITGVSAETIPAENEATVKNVGTPYEAEFLFGIPRGIAALTSTSISTFTTVPTVGEDIEVYSAQSFNRKPIVGDSYVSYTKSADNNDLVYMLINQVTSVPADLEEGGIFDITCIYVGRLTGIQGIQGETGEQGPQGEPGIGWYYANSDVAPSFTETMSRNDIYPVSPSPLRTDELVLFADGTVGEVVSQSASEVTLSLSTINLKGPQGLTGAQGPQGDPGLSPISVIRNFTNEYAVGANVSVVYSDFTRTPVVGDMFSNLMADKYFATYEVTAVNASSSTATCKVLSKVNISGKVDTGNLLKNSVTVNRQAGETYGDMVNLGYALGLEEGKEYTVKYKFNGTDIVATAKYEAVAEGTIEGATLALCQSISAEGQTMKMPMLLGVQNYNASLEEYQSAALDYGFLYIVDKHQITSDAIYTADENNSSVYVRALQSANAQNSVNVEIYAIGQFTEIIADKAIADEEGNNIIATYAKQNGSYPNMTVGTSKTLTAIQLTSEDIHNLRGAEHWGKTYFAPGGNSVTSKPAGVDGFVLEVLRGGNQSTVHRLMSTADSSGESASPNIYLEQYITSWSNWEEVTTADGKYPTLQAGRLVTQKKITATSAALAGWHKFAEVQYTVAQYNYSYSAIVLVNSVNSTQYAETQKTVSESGTIEIDFYKENVADPIQIAVSVLSGNINADELCAVLDTANNKLCLYTYLNQYQATAWALLSEEQTYNYAKLVFTSEYYGSTAPDGAIYAKVRNNAGKLDNLPASNYLKRRLTNAGIYKHESGTELPGDVLIPTMGFGNSQYQEIWGVDWNDMIEDGHFLIRGNTQYPSANAPVDSDSPASNGIWHAIVLSYGDDWVIQIAIDVRSAGTGKFQWRSKAGGSWGVWRLLSHNNLPTTTYTTPPTSANANGTVLAILSEDPGTYKPGVLYLW